MYPCFKLLFCCQYVIFFWASAFGNVFICILLPDPFLSEFLDVRERGLLGGAWLCPRCLWPGCENKGCLRITAEERGCPCRSELSGDKASATVKGACFNQSFPLSPFLPLKNHPPCLKTFKQANPFGNEVRRWGMCRFLTHLGKPKLSCSRP